MVAPGPSCTRTVTVALASDSCQHGVPDHYWNHPSLGAFCPFSTENIRVVPIWYCGSVPEIGRESAEIRLPEGSILGPQPWQESTREPLRNIQSEIEKERHFLKIPVEAAIPKRFRAVRLCDPSQP
eukprot:3475730-Rhodomonas_salina.2